ncbi:Hypothetical predicted protein [Paramuricea clavata]|uniref:Uncharacterized protein n=1 Tax=Paramuricea clavata TaxID=317549 RepID=A0A7D9EHH8_PARCT|nr:Hypothetical predicted protein [Paramuricea clavata]
MSTKADSLVSELSDMDLDLELTPLGNDDISVHVNRRFKKQTDKGRAYQIERKKEHCKSIQKRITKIMKTIESSITDWDNVHEVQNDLEVFSQQLVEFQAAYEAWRDLLSGQQLVPVTDWYDEHFRIMNNCKVKIVDWIAVAKYKIEEQMDDKSSALKSSIESRRSAGSRHSSTSGRARERAKVAELRAKAALLEKKQALENESEKLRLQEELAIAQAREQAFIQNDIELKREATIDGMNEYLGDTRPMPKENLLHDQLTKNIPTPQFSSTNIPQPTPVSAFHSRRAHQTPVRLPQYSSHEWKPPPSEYRNRVTLDNDPLIYLLEKQNRLTEMLSEQHQQNFLPSLSLSSFKGDPTEYHLFIRTFGMRVERNVKSSGARMQYLQQYLDGEPKDLIKGCHYMEPDAGYVEAMKLLNEKYGDPYKVSNAYLKKVNDWPTLRPGDDNALEKLAIFLTQCLSAMESLSYLVTLDHPNNLQCLVKKLPFYQQERWRREVTKLREKSKNPAFKHFVNFVKTEAKIATDPIFSRQALDKIGQDDKSKFKRGSTSKFTSNATMMKEESPNSCIACNGFHDLDECKVYLKKSLSERRALIAKRGLCCACYGSGHRSRGCIQRRSCKTCSGRHPTGLHDENFRMKNKNSDEPSKDIDRTEDGNSDNQRKSCSYAAAHEVVCDSSNVKFSIESMPIVPVRLRSNDKEIITYAMLDSCSTGTFISEDAVKRLEVNGTDTKVMIRTMNGPKMHDTKVVNGLIVSDLDGANSITLPKVFSRDEIPGRKSEIPRQELCRKWKHLERVVEQVHPYMENVKIGLLIGTNCPQAIEPRDFVASNNGGPFAVLTFAGWTIVGPLYLSDNENEVDCHRIVVQEIGSDKPSEHHFMVEDSVKELVTPESLNKMFELEFNERHCQKEQYSQEDKRFMEKIQRDTEYVNGHYVIPLPFRDDDS